MKRSDRMILLVLPVLALAVGFWLLVLSPKQKEASELQDRLDAAVERQRTASAELAAAESAREAFADNYADLVKLGPAVPETSDQATLIYEMAEIGRSNTVNFRAFAVNSSGGAAPVAPAAAAPAAPSVEPSATEPTGSTPVAAPATEATAASLPIGATVGPAGLPITPYSFKFLGDFFDMADFFADVDALVDTKAGGEPRIDGRLLTIDGFALTGDPLRGFPRVQADFEVTTYLVPPEQGLSAGATPSGPAPAGSQAAPTPVAGGDPAATAPAAVVAP